MTGCRTRWLFPFVVVRGAETLSRSWGTRGSELRYWSAGFSYTTAAAEFTGVFLDRVGGKKYKMAGADADGKMAARVPLAAPGSRPGRAQRVRLGFHAGL